jgi:hypothetical protein
MEDSNKLTESKLKQVDSAFKTFGDEKNLIEYVFFKDIGITSLRLSGLQKLIIPGSTISSSGRSYERRLEDDDIFILTNGLADAKIRLETLSLRNHRISDVGFETICSDIVSKGSLRTLDLEGNDIEGIYMYIYIYINRCIYVQIYSMHALFVCECIRTQYTYMFISYIYFYTIF